jgi:hypothetical protein
MAQDKQIKSPIQYRVQPGDSLGKIAKKFHTNADELKKLNKLASGTIFPEQVLWIYGTGVDVGPKMPKPKPPKMAAPSPRPPTAAPSRPKASAADAVPVVRGKEGEGKPLALITAEPGRAPWMAVAVAEAKKWQGKEEAEINKEINYHRQVTDSDRSGGRKIALRMV